MSAGRLLRAAPICVPLLLVSVYCLIDQAAGARLSLTRPTLRPPLTPGHIKLEANFGPCLLHLYEPCSSSKLIFYYIPNNDTSNPIIFDSEDPDPIASKGFNSSLPTKVLIHGYNGSLYYEPTYKIARAYLNEGETNVVVLDWRAYSNLPCYPSAVINTWQAGKCLAKVLQDVASWTGAPGHFFARLHIIGFSLGAHVAGFASSYLKPFRIGRITGLDPALPFFASLSRSWKLDANDARFVDVIHTNVGVLGKVDNTGHADFYVNGGSVQPACNNSQRPLCNHLLAPSYFAESISKKTPGFYGWPCQSFLYYVVGWCDENRARQDAAVMGEHCPRGTRGVFFVNTGSKSPFGLGLHWLDDEEDLLLDDELGDDAAPEAAAATTTQPNFEDESSGDGDLLPITNSDLETHNLV